MRTRHELAERALIALSEGDFEALYYVSQIARELGFSELNNALDLLLETALETTGSDL